MISSRLHFLSRLLWAVATLVLGIGLSCALWPSEKASSQWTFDEIQELVRGKNAGQVHDLLGEPDSRESVFGGDERWIWWSYTTLQGASYPPEVRGEVVHLEILFQNPGGLGRRLPYSDWFIDEVNGVDYRLPKLTERTTR